MNVQTEGTALSENVRCAWLPDKLGPDNSDFQPHIFHRQNIITQSIADKIAKDGVLRSLCLQIRRNFHGNNGTTYHRCNTSFPG